MFDFLKGAEPVSQCTPPKFVPVEVLNEGEQKKLVAEYIEKAKGYTFLINRCLDSQDVDGAFNHGAALADLLQTESFNPHNYYELYNVVSEALLNLGFQVSDKNRFTNEQVCSQYEIAQYRKGVVQRLYLMITVAPELSTRGYARVLDVLSDLAVMIKQSQNVTHSLFLRYFLLCAYKSHLADSTPVETERTVHFLLHNFAQMNRMWVRMAEAHASASAEVSKPSSSPDNEKVLSNQEQRKELSVLVGMNLSRVSSLNNLTPEMYSKIILPYVLKHVDLCEDALAQSEILQFIVHAFPADFQMLTVDQLFGIFGKVDQSVPILSIVNQLLTRFLGFDGELIDSTSGKTTFVTVAKNIEELFNSEGSLALINKFEVLEKLLRFALKVNSKDVRNIKNLFKFADFQIDLAIGEEQLTSKDASRALLSFVKSPFDAFKWNSDDSEEEAETSPLVILSQIDHLPSLIKRLLPSDRGIIATEICKILIHSSITITTLAQFSFILNLTSSLVREGPGSSYFFAMLTLIDTGSVESTMSIVQELANVMDTAFTEKAASKAVLPIGFKVIRLMHDAEKDSLIKLVQFLAQFVKRNAPKNPKSCVQLCIEAARTLDRLEFGEEATQFATTAVSDFFDLLRGQYEKRRGTEGISALFDVFLYVTNFVVSATTVDFATSLNSQLCSIAATFSSDSQSGDSQNSNLANLKPVQATIACSSFANCANLFWRKDQRMNEVKNVQACLAKACQVAATNSNLAVSLELLYSVLSWAVFFIENGCSIDIKWIQALISLIRKKQGEIEQSGQSLDTAISKTTRNFYTNTVKHIQENNLIQGDNGGDDDEEDEGDWNGEGEGDEDGDGEAEEDE
ncbi:Vacuolar protein sorting-associated protein 35 [Tritrichomonas musculus]|uniref:Vacuolar protein sorting-associated protein 35 n=1 Tax=Tritrichomonas musculus TaxID=1915356 RepID=A0ABR2KSB9_9EUKA